MRGHTWFRYSTVVALAMCWITILLGGNVIATNSGLGCIDWPTCYGGWNLFPAIVGATGIEWTHRVAAFFLALSILVVTVLAIAYERRRPAYLRLSLGALGLVVILALLGGAVVLSGLDTALVLLHFGVATVLLAVLLVLAILANWKHLPPRWKTWLQRADEPVAAPTAPVESAAPAGTPTPVVAGSAGSAQG